MIVRAQHVHDESHSHQDNHDDSVTPHVFVNTNHIPLERMPATDYDQGRMKSRVGHFPSCTTMVVVHQHCPFCHTLKRTMKQTPVDNGEIRATQAHSESGEGWRVMRITVKLLHKFCRRVCGALFPRHRVPGATHNLAPHKGPGEKDTAVARD